MIELGDFDFLETLDENNKLIYKLVERGITPEEYKLCYENHQERIKEQTGVENIKEGMKLYVLNAGQYATCANTITGTVVDRNKLSSNISIHGLYTDVQGFCILKDNSNIAYWVNLPNIRGAKYIEIK